MNPSPPFPPVLAELHQLPFDYDHGDGIDFEPYGAFLEPDSVRSWFRAWTGNEEADGHEFLVFGQDGTGGYAAFWNRHPDRSLLEQPVVFLGSEGEMGVVARDVDAYLWLLASGHGPLEAVEFPDDERPPDAAFTAFARAHSASGPRPASALLAEAAAAYPDFAGWVEGQIR